MTYVSDMDTNLPQATIKLTNTECIVEILRILWVDSTCKHLAEILTTIYLLRCNGSINLICSILHVLRIFIRQIILRKDSMHLGIVLTCLTKDINHRADNVFMLIIRPLHHFDNGFIIRLSALKFPLRDDDIVDEVWVLGNEEGHILLYSQLSYYLVVRTLYNLNDHRLLDMFVATGHIRYLHLVAIHCRH